MTVVGNERVSDCQTGLYCTVPESDAVHRGEDVLVHYVDFNTRENCLDVLFQLMDAAVHRRYLDVHVHGEEFIHYDLGYLNDACMCLGNSCRDFGEYADIVLSDYSQNSFFSCFFFFLTPDYVKVTIDDFEKMNHPPAK